MKISLDLAAGANIDLKAAASAVGRAYTGNLTALNKLAPGIKKLKDPLAEVEKRFKGLAALQAENDPFTQMTIVMDEFKEKLGKSFLPVVKSFAQFMNSPEFQKGLEDIALKVQKFGEWFASPEGQEAFKGWMKDLKNLITLAGQFLGLVAQVAALLTPVKNKTRDGLATDYAPGTKFHPLTPGELSARVGGPKTNSAGVPYVDNRKTSITINGVTNASQVVTELQKLAQKKGIPLSKLLK